MIWKWIVCMDMTSRRCAKFWHTLSYTQLHAVEISDVNLWCVLVLLAMKIRMNVKAVGAGRCCRAEFPLLLMWWFLLTCVSNTKRVVIDGLGVLCVRCVLKGLSNCSVCQWSSEPDTVILRNDLRSVSKRLSMNCLSRFTPGQSPLWVFATHHLYHLKCLPLSFSLSHQVLEL